LKSQDVSKGHHRPNQELKPVEEDKKVRNEQNRAVRKKHEATYHGTIDEEVIESLMSDNDRLDVDAKKHTQPSKNKECGLHVDQLMAPVEFRG
jgi:hypothetical protein